MIKPLSFVGFLRHFARVSSGEGQGRVLKLWRILRSVDAEPYQSRRPSGHDRMPEFRGRSWRWLNHARWKLELPRVARLERADFSHAAAFGRLETRRGPLEP